TDFSFIQNVWSSITSRTATKMNDSSGPAITSTVLLKLKPFHKATRYPLIFFLFAIVFCFTFGTLRGSFSSNDALEGLKTLRGNNLIHLDLKPQNLIISTDGDNNALKIADFSFARQSSGVL
ncbi:kinase family protein, partial [Striga asiatica]